MTGVASTTRGPRFEFKPGAVFANLVVGDEINRASPKTQAALLECMEERQVTVDGTTYQLQVPFMVIATQNPIEMEGTYPLPEAQLDRFTARIAVGYPSAEAELAMLDAHGGVDTIHELRPFSDAATVRRMIAQSAPSTWRRRSRIHGQPGQRHPRVPGAAPGRLPPGHPAPTADRPGDRGAGRPGVRAAGRPAVAGGAGTRSPGDLHR